MNVERFEGLRNAEIANVVVRADVIHVVVLLFVNNLG